MSYKGPNFFFYTYIFYFFCTYIFISDIYIFFFARNPSFNCLTHASYYWIITHWSCSEIFLVNLLTCGENDWPLYSCTANYFWNSFEIELNPVPSDGFGTKRSYIFFLPLWSCNQILFDHRTVSLRVGLLGPPLVCRTNYFYNN